MNASRCVSQRLGVPTGPKFQPYSPFRKGWFLNVRLFAINSNSQPEIDLLGEHALFLIRNCYVCRFMARWEWSNLSCTLGGLLVLGSRALGSLSTRDICQRFQDPDRYHFEAFPIHRSTPLWTRHLAPQYFSGYAFGLPVIGPPTIVPPDGPQYYR